MLTKRIIPCLDIDAGRVVKGVRFQDLRVSGDPVVIASGYEAEEADELVLLDITASHENRDIMSAVVRRVSDAVFMPLTVGGGIRGVEDADALVQAGAEKVSVNSAAVRNPALITELARRFGSCAVVVSIDAKRTETGETPAWAVYTHGGRRKTDLDVLAWAKRAEELGAGEILLTSIDSDGTQVGYDLPLVRAATQTVRIPVVASGGAGCPQHLQQALHAGADAVLAASILHNGDYGVHEIKHFLAQRGVAVRLPLASPTGQ